MNFIKHVHDRARAIAFTAIWLALCITFSSREDHQAYGQTHGVNTFSNRNVRIGVLGLFHTPEFRVSATAGQALLLYSGSERLILEKSSGVDMALIRISDHGVIATAGTRVISASAISIAGRSGEPANFVLAVPGKIERRYHGILEVKASTNNLLAIVTEDEETAVASVVAAESTQDAPLEALKAQAVATRSYFYAGRGRHANFDFCDTTHCQFMRNPPEQGSRVANAVSATRGLVLAYNSAPFAAMYTRSCSGRTHTPAEVGLRTSSYPYYSVECEYCRSHPVRWTTRLSANDAASLKNLDDTSRLNIDRRLGWSAVPSNDFVANQDGEHVVLTGSGAGHGIGLCQSGAKAMAENGGDFREILRHYYPNTTIVRLSDGNVVEQPERSGQ
jgi:stage II sporulation protein D